MLGRSEPLLETAAAEADLSGIPDYIRTYVPDEDLRQRLALRDQRVVDAAATAVSEAIKAGELAPKGAQDIMFYDGCFKDGVTDGK